MASWTKYRWDEKQQKYVAVSGPDQSSPYAPSSTASGKTSTSSSASRGETNRNGRGIPAGKTSQPTYGSLSSYSSYASEKPKNFFEALEKSWGDWLEFTRKQRGEVDETPEQREARSSLAQAAVNDLGKMRSVQSGLQSVVDGVASGKGDFAKFQAGKDAYNADMYYWNLLQHIDALDISDAEKQSILGSASQRRTFANEIYDLASRSADTGGTAKDVQEEASRINRRWGYNAVSDALKQQAPNDMRKAGSTPVDIPANYDLDAFSEDRFKYLYGESISGEKITEQERQAAKQRLEMATGIEDVSKVTDWSKVDYDPDYMADMQRLNRGVETYSDLWNMTGAYSNEDVQNDLMTIQDYQNGQRAGTSPFYLAPQVSEDAYQRALDRVYALTGIDMSDAGNYEKNSAAVRDIDAVMRQTAAEPIMQVAGDMPEGTAPSVEDYQTYLSAYAKQQSYIEREQREAAELDRLMQDKWGGYSGGKYSPRERGWTGTYSDADLIYELVAAGDDEERRAEVIWSGTNAVGNDFALNRRFNAGYQFMTDAERGQFFDVWNEEGPERALEYLDDLSPKLLKAENKRKEESYAAFANENPLAANLAARLGTMVSAAEYIPNVISNALTGKQFSDAGARFTQAVTSRTAQNIADATPNAELFGKNIPALLYQAGTAAADSGLLALSGNPTLATAVLSSSAANATLTSRLDEGADFTDAIRDSAAVGVIEMLTEKYSVEALMSDPASLLGYIGKNMATEAAEEMTSSVLNIAYDMVAYGDDSEVAQRFRQLVIEGYSPEEAFGQVAKEKAGETIESGVVGALSGGMGATPSGTATAISDRSSGKNLQKNDAARSVLDLAGKMLPDGDIKALATEQLKALDGEGKTSNSAIGRVFRELLANVDEQTRQILDGTMLRNVRAQLSEMGVDDGRIAEAVTRIAAGDGSASQEDYVAVATNDAARVVAKSLTDQVNYASDLNNQMGEFAEKAAKPPKTKNTEHTTANATEEAPATEAADEEFVDDEFAEDEFSDEEIADEEFADEPMSDSSVTSDGEEVSVVGVESVDKSGELTFKVQTADGTQKSVKASDVTLGLNDSDAVVLARAAQEYGANADTMFNAHVPGQDAAEYAAAFKKAAQYGRDGMNMETISGYDSVKALNPNQLGIAYELGRAERISRSKSARNIMAERMIANGKVKTGNVDISGINVSGLNQHQKRSIVAMRNMAELLGINVKFTESVADEQGRYTTANGSWSSKTLTLTLDVHAGTNIATDINYAMMHTASHELTHAIFKFAYTDVRDDYIDFVLGSLGRKMGDAAVEAEIAKWLERPGIDSRDAAIEEIVAEASVEALSKMTEQDIRNLAMEKPSLARRIATSIYDWVARMKAKIAKAFGGTEAKNEYAKMLNDQLDELAEKWNSALLNAVQNKNKIQRAAFEKQMEQGVEIKSGRRSRTADRYAASETDQSSEGDDYIPLDDDDGSSMRIRPERRSERRAERRAERGGRERVDREGNKTRSGRRAATKEKRNNAKYARGDFETSDGVIEVGNVDLDAITDDKFWGEVADGADIAVDAENELKFSLREDERLMQSATEANAKSGYVEDAVLKAAEEARAKVAAFMRDDSRDLNLPEDLMGNTFFSDAAYGGSEENTTVCPRSIGADAFLDAVSDSLGRPLTVAEQVRISQDIIGAADIKDPQCVYCYVAADRAAYREFLGKYIEQRDGVIEALKSGETDLAKLYETFLDGRKDTPNMRKRFKLWVDTVQSGKRLLSASDLANIGVLAAIQSDKYKQLSADKNFAAQMKDALAYAQSASWAKKRVNYVAYNGHILKWKQARIDKLNSMYGLRMYSFSDFSPAFALENMQMVTDASVRGLKMLAYTKVADFAKIFAKTGMNINISVFATEVRGDSGSSIVENNLMGADWKESQKLRAEHPNIGITFVATSDAQIEWALDQDWIDVVVPYHLVRTGRTIAEMMKYKNYTAESSDVKKPEWSKANGNLSSIPAALHNNDRDTYMRLLEENNLTPRFARFVDHPNYMKLVNETRQSITTSQPVQPIFDIDAAINALQNMANNGGYYVPIGGSEQRMYELANEFAEKVNRGEYKDTASESEFTDDSDTKLQLRAPDQVSDRELLANVMDSAAETQAELNFVRRYRKQIEQLDEKQRELERVGREITEARKNGARKSDIAVMQEKAKILRKQLDRMDGKLLEFEAGKPLQAVVKRQRAKLQEKARERTRKLVEEVRKKDDAYREKLLTGLRDRKNESFARQKYLAEVKAGADKLREMVTTPTNKKHVPEILRKPMAEFLDAFDFASNRQLEGGEPTKADLRMADAYDAMKKAIERMQKHQSGIDTTGAEYFSGYLDLSNSYIEEFDNIMVKMRAAIEASGRISDTPIHQMKSEDLHELAKLLRILHSSINKMNKMLANAKYATADAAAEDSMTDLDEVKMGKERIKLFGKMVDFIDWKNATPYYAFERFGRGGKAIFESLMNGWDKLAFNAQKLVDFTKSVYNPSEVAEWERDVKNVKLSSGETVRMSAAQLMSIYCLAKRAQAVGHLMGGGIRVADIDGKRGKTISQTDNYTLNEEDLEAMRGLLTDRQREVADKLQADMVERGANWGNEVSMKRFGYKMFTEPNYFPVESDKNNMQEKDEEAQENSLLRLLNMSATKDLTPNATNAIVIRSIFDVYTAHMSDMAKYNALGLQILDAMKWLNYVERTDEVDKNGEKTGKIKTRSVRKSLENAYGAEARRYIVSFIRNLNGDVEAGLEDGIFNRMTSNYKIAAVGANLRVGMLQITSMPRAATVIDPKYLMAGLAKWNARRGKTSKQAIEKVGIAKWKSMGFYDTNISRNLRQMIKHDETAVDKVREGSMKLAEWGDAWTMGVLYGAVESELLHTEKKLAPGTEAWDKRVNERMREIIYRTQVVDSTMTRSHLMRQKGAISGALAFMSEPTLTLNMLNDAIFKVRMDARQGKKWNPATAKTVAKVMAVTATVNVFAAMVEALFSALRDDDEFEKFSEKYLTALLGDYSDAETFGDRLSAFMSGSYGSKLNLLDNIPVVSDIIDAAKSGAADQMWQAFAGEIGEGYRAMMKVMREGGSLADYYRAVYKLMGGTSKAVGMPVSNAMRDVVSIYNTIVAEPMGWRRLQTYENTNSEAAAALLEAQIAGNDKKTAKVRERIAAYNMDQAKIAQALAKQAEEAYAMGRIDRSEAEAYMTGDGGKRSREADEALTEADYQIETGRKHNDMKDDFVSGLITEQQAREYLKKYDGLRDDEIDTKISQWKYDKETGLKYSEMKLDYIDGVLTDSQVVNYRTKYGGADQDSAEETLGHWKYEKDTGLAWSDMEDDYADGVINEYEVRDALARYGGKNEEEVEDKISNFDYHIATGRSTTAPKYWRIAYAFDTGGDYVSYIDQYFQKIMYGGETTRTWKQARSSIASSLASYYKSQYLAAKGTPAGAAMLERILDLYEAIGYDREYERQYIAENW